jgi:linoleoyl-CoA desaturase
METIKFASNNEFRKTLKKRVGDYFKDNNISKYGNATMVIKTIFMLCLFYVPFVLYLVGIFDNIGLNLLLWAVIGLGMSGIGLSVMHDANHGSYSKKKWVNTALGYTLNLMGGHALNWQVQHNVLHHTYTNVTEVDRDIDPGPLMRFTPEQPLRKHHKYQHIYAWFLYTLLSASWIFTKDFKQLRQFRDQGLLVGRAAYNKLLIELIISKVFYYGYLIVLPIILRPEMWWVSVLGMFIMHFVCGFILSCIFQLAHVMPENDFPMPVDGKMERSFEEHQLHTTANFSNGNRPFSWFVGGLNYQIEHHLFPHICHVHYRKISKIVKKTALEFNMPYKSQKNFFKALVYHGRLLKKLGRNENI